MIGFKWTAVVVKTAVNFSISAHRFYTSKTYTRINIDDKKNSAYASADRSGAGAYGARRHIRGALGPRARRIFFSAPIIEIRRVRGEPGLCMCEYNLFSYVYLDRLCE